MEYYSQKIEQVLTELRSSKSGLASHQVQEKTKTGQVNKLDDVKKPSFLSKFFAQFKDLMVIILIISAVISIVIALATKNYQNLFEGGLILFIVVLNATMGVVQENKAENALESLKKNTEPFCNVIRDGKIQNIKAQNLVLGDLVLLSAGNIIPADLRLIETYNLSVDESSITGESLAVEKNADVVLDKHTPLGERKNMAFSGSVVTYGRGVGVVTAIGKDTEIGKIAVMITSGKKELTPLQKSLNKVGQILSISVIIISIIIFAVEMIVPKSPNMLSAFMTAVALAVAAIPESLPATITIIMALSVQRLSKQNAIIKRMHAIENLGSCQVICSDKTGTLTQNKMTVKNVFYDNILVSTANDNDVVKKHFKEIIKTMVLCNNSEFVDGKIIGEPTETALFRFAMKNGFNVKELRAENKRIYELPFDSKRKMMTTVNKTKDGLTVYAKGALDFLIGKCTKILSNGCVKELSQEHIKQIEKANINMAEKALRVIAVAYKPVESFDKNNLENGLIFLGLVGMIDPPRKETKDAIKQCHRAGLKAVMITGDHAETAFAIAKEIGIASSKNQVLTGAELDKISDEKLAKVVGQYSVFARVSPEHKVRIVKAFKKNEKIVAMTGDGVNDAPSLKNADVGIGMGISGTDVTKEVADMIVSDDNFATIILAVKEGRKIYANIQRTIQFLLSTNAVEVFTLFITSLFFPNFMFLLPSQLLFINFITDSLPAISLGLEPEEPDIMTTPPRDNKENIINLDIWKKILLQAGLQICLVLTIYVIGLKNFDEHVASTMAFFVINIMQLLHAVNLKSKQSIFKTKIFANKVFNYSFLIALSLVLLVAFIPPLSAAFGLCSLNFVQWLLVVGFSISNIIFVEISKYISKKYR